MDRAAAEVRIRELAHRDRRAKSAFIDLPFRLYRRSAHWVPPMRAELELALDRSRHPFYRDGDAAFFLAERQGQIVGRIAALDNHRYNRHNQTRVGFFHYFESEDDRQVAEALTEAAARWLEARGLRTMIGPRGLLQGEGTGLLVEGFEHRPAMGIPYHLPYYRSLLEEIGFTKLIDFRSGFVPGDYRLDERVRRIARQVMVHRNYSVRRFNTKAELQAWIPQVRQVYNQAFAEAFSGPLGFTPMTIEEAERMADRILSLARPDLIKLVLQGEDLVGFLFAYPNIGPALRRAGGRLWPLGWLHILWELRTTRWLDVNGIGVLPSHQGRGANAVLYSELEKTVAGGRFEHADIVQVREENLKSLGDMRALGVTWYKRHRLYQRALARV